MVPYLFTGLVEYLVGLRISRGVRKLVWIPRVTNKEEEEEEEK